MTNFIIKTYRKIFGKNKLAAVENSETTNSIDSSQENLVPQENSNIENCESVNYYDCNQENLVLKRPTLIENYELINACKHGQVKIILQLLKKPKVQALIASETNLALKYATEFPSPNMEKVAIRLLNSAEVIAQLEYDKNYYKFLLYAINAKKTKLAICLININIPSLNKEDLIVLIKKSFEFNLVAVVKSFLEYDGINKMIKTSLGDPFPLEFLYDYAFSQDTILFYNLLTKFGPVDIEKLEKENIIKMDNIVYPYLRWKLVKTALFDKAWFLIDDKDYCLSNELIAYGAEYEKFKLSTVLKMVFQCYEIDQILRDKLTQTHNDPVISTLILSFGIPVSLKRVKLNRRNYPQKEIDRVFYMYTHQIGLSKKSITELPNLFLNPNAYTNKDEVENIYNKIYWSEPTVPKVTY